MFESDWKISRQGGLIFFRVGTYYLYMCHFWLLLGKEHKKHWHERMRRWLFMWRQYCTRNSSHVKHTWVQKGALSTSSLCLFGLLTEQAQHANPQRDICFLYRYNMLEIKTHHGDFYQGQIFDFNLQSLFGVSFLRPQIFAANMFSTLSTNLLSVQYIKFRFYF